MALAEVSLNDKYRLDSGRIYLSGSQALVRLALMQRRRDLARGLNTAGFVSGYRGSPLHSLDLEFQKVPDLLDEHHVRFQPAINEDLAATAVRGSQMAGIYDKSLRYDGVFSFWYGKSPGLDRSIDAIRHANLCGTSPHGGVLAITGDDHGMRSTDTLAHCEATFEDVMMPLLYPANVQDVLDMGLLGIELSRFCGAWVGFKIVPETVECSAVVDVDPQRVVTHLPEFEFPEGGVHVRANDIWFFGWDQRLTRFKIPAAIAFGKANSINRVTHAAERPRFGIVAAGKAWLDVLEALRSLGLNQREMERFGLTVFKVGMVWPHDLEGYREFASDLEEVMIVEEKREQIDRALRSARRPADQRAARADTRRHRSCDRAAPAGIETAGERKTAHRAAGENGGKAGRDDAADTGPAAVFLFGLPAQHIDAGTRRQQSARRDRMSWHGLAGGTGG
jgi:indolepyruvate ferredoxin oxidoreductase